MTLVALTFEKGSLILIEYTASLKDDGTVIETTNKTTAEAHSIYEITETYGPKLVSINEINYPVFKGLADKLAEMSVGAENIIELEPEQAWGARDTKKVRMYSIRKLGKDAEQHSIGDSIEIDNKKGILRFIGSGRVQIDFNHEYAGKALVYDVAIKAHLEQPDEIIAEILKARLKTTSTIFEMNSNSIDVKLSDDILEYDKLPAAKRHIVRDLFKFLPHLDSVQFIEKYPNKSKSTDSEKIADVESNDSSSNDTTPSSKTGSSNIIDETEIDNDLFGNT